MTRAHRTASFLVLALAGGIIAVPAGSAGGVVDGPVGTKILWDFAGLDAFRARMRKISAGATSAWSPPLSLTA